MRLPRLSKRRQLRTMLVAALDRLEANQQTLHWPVPDSEPEVARVPGICPVCGLPWQPGEEIVEGLWPDKLRMWMHVTHPDLWQALRDNLEREDNALITWVGVGRGAIQDRLGVGLRRPQSRFRGQHTDYISWDEAKERGLL